MSRFAAPAAATDHNAGAVPTTQKQLLVLLRFTPIESVACQRPA
jgi:hypothetical protein